MATYLGMLSRSNIFRALDTSSCIAVGASGKSGWEVARSNPDYAVNMLPHVEKRRVMNWVLSGPITCWNTIPAWQPDRRLSAAIYIQQEACQIPPSSLTELEPQQALLTLGGRLGYVCSRSRIS
jgi:hypothetical protein